jgi:hypothetical protein
MTHHNSVGAGSLLTSPVKSIGGELLGVNKPALATQQPTNMVNSQNKFTTKYAKRACFKYVSNDNINRLNTQSVNEPFPPRKSAITMFANDTVGFSRWNPTVMIFYLGGHYV